MDDDFNTARALAVLFDGVTAGNSVFGSDKLSPAEKSAFLRELAGDIKELAKVIGLNFAKKDISAEVRKSIGKKVTAREEARRKKDYKLADDIRKSLELDGVIIEDTKDGPEWRLK